ncbi:MAG: NADH-quinone oxidoreductase subunit M [Deltaproteobacteria bacterium]|nr:NADH-quinone oxidoreductase subunit M [Deltaproteobacteria bacterium]
MEHSVLSLMIFIPIAGMVAILCLPGQAQDLVKKVALAFTIPPLLLGIWLFLNFNRATPELQFVVKVPWIAAYNIEYFVGVDGISISMVLLTALLCPICILAAWGIDRAVKGYFALFLLLDAAMVGVFCAMDFFLFYIFWEIMLLPMYFLIGVWGGPRREYAAIKFFLYTLFGSVLMLLAMLALYFSVTTIDPGTGEKMHFQLAPYFLGALGAWNIVYGALCALAQCFIEPKDMKKLVAYSSISHMGYVMLGMASFTPQGINGAVLQMFNHGTITAMLFLIVGVIYDRAHHRRIDGFGGLASVMPVYTGVMALAFFAAMGLPGLSAFISEVLVLLGAWQRYKIPTVMGAATVILTAGYLLWTIQQMFLGKPREDYAQMHLSEINARELCMLIPIGVVVLILGVYPHAVLDLLNVSLLNLNKIVLAAAQGTAVALH